MDIKNIWSKIIDFFGFHNNISEEGQLVNENEDKRIISIYKNEGFRIMVYSPDSFTEVQAIVDQLKAKKPIIINLEELEREKARRIIDFISGAVYGIDGSVQKISDAIFVFAPDNIQLDGQIINKNKSLFR